MAQISGSFLDADIVDASAHCSSYNGEIVNVVFVLLPKVKVKKLRLNLHFARCEKANIVT